MMFPMVAEVITGNERPKPWVIITFSSSSILGFFIGDRLDLDFVNPMIILLQCHHELAPK